jgi:hypothetical protein
LHRCNSVQSPFGRRCHLFGAAMTRGPGQPRSTDSIPQGIIGGLDVNGFFPAIASRQSDAIANGSQVERSAVRSSSFSRPLFLRDNFGPFGLVIEGEMWGPPHTLFGAECNVTGAAPRRISSTARSANDRFQSDRSVGVNCHR